MPEVPAPPYRVPSEDPDIYPLTPHPPGKEWPTGVEQFIGIGHVGPYWPYDPNDPRAPSLRERRAPGFVTADDYVRGGVVRQYAKPRRPPKRAN